MERIDLSFKKHRVLPKWHQSASMEIVRDKPPRIWFAFDCHVGRSVLTSNKHMGSTINREISTDCPSIVEF